MSDSNSNTYNGGIGFSSLLFIVFLVLKLGVGDTVVKSWSWWWVCAPLWGPVVLTLAILLIVGIIYAVVKIIRDY